jgi:uncharacterized protein with HEPN domain
VKEGGATNETNLALGIDHLRRAVRIAEREGDPLPEQDEYDLVFIAVESELRKAYESLNRLGRSFWSANRSVSRDRIGEIRQILTHDYAGVDRQTVWDIAREEAPKLVHQLVKAKMGRSD